MISITKADLRFAVQRLISSFISMLTGLSFVDNTLSRKSLGHYRSALVTQAAGAHPHHRQGATLSQTPVTHPAHHLATSRC
jgi:hypothetical protein